MTARSSDRMRVGIVGCGTIAGAYLRGCTTFDILDVVALTDLYRSRAEARAAEFGVERALAVDELLHDPAIELVLNLTIPAAHAAVSLAAIDAGKHVYAEKPLALDRDEGRRVVEAADRAGVRLGCAPDTFLGGGLQTCRAAIDAGTIGRPLSATAFMLSRGPESWHPDPGFLYQPGAGPLFDMGPYYLTALVSLLGPITKVAGSATIGVDERTVGSGPRAGTTFRPSTPTHVTGLLSFASGAVATLTTSFDVAASEHPRIEIHGSEGTLSVPDPNRFGGPVRVRRSGDDAWRELPLSHGRTENRRGLGAADLAHAVRAERPPRAGGALALHVLDVMQTILEAAEAERTLRVESSVARPEPLDPGLPDGVLEAGWSASPGPTASPAPGPAATDAPADAARREESDHD